MLFSDFIKYRKFLRYNNINEMSQVLPEIHKGFLIDMMNQKLIKHNTQIIRDGDFSYFYPDKMSIVIFVSDERDVLGAVMFEQSDIFNNTYEEQVVGVFEEFYDLKKGVMDKIYKYFMNKFNCNILSDYKHSNASFNQWIKFMKTENIDIINIETKNIIEYKDKYFKNNKESRKYRFLWRAK